MRRRAAMSRAVLPKMTAHEVWLLAGHSERDSLAGRRLPALDEDGPSEYGDDDEPMQVEAAAGTGATTAEGQGEPMGRGS